MLHRDDGYMGFLYRDARSLNFFCRDAMNFTDGLRKDGASALSLDFSFPLSRTAAPVSPFSGTEIWEDTVEKIHIIIILGGVCSR